MSEGYYRYVSLGMSLSGKAGKVSYFHSRCWLQLPVVAGSSAVRIVGKPPTSAMCYECRESIKEAD